MPGGHASAFGEGVDEGFVEVKDKGFGWGVVARRGAGVGCGVRWLAARDKRTGWRRRMWIFGYLVGLGMRGWRLDVVHSQVRSVARGWSGRRIGFLGFAAFASVFVVKPDANRASGGCDVIT